ncbi:hypothetical protein Pmani_038835 [Petrolisthes manimaculis]|uniref:Cystatin domain-containing protein n=1 Tax=Petrolisthes manimaculis TaxID=1843537 RepID=A0AAE1NDW0_9EUCA|nr:hypothetical protein Pmani_038835 [Petrolisthes manimaculis]
MGGLLQLVLVTFLFYCSVGSGVGGVGVPGGASPEQPPNDQVQQIINNVREEVEKELGHSVTEFSLISYKTQVVAGTNYFAKVDIGEGEDSMVHIRVYKNLGGNVSLHSIQYPKSRNHSVEYFQ